MASVCSEARKDSFTSEMQLCGCQPKLAHMLLSMWFRSYADSMTQNPELEDSLSQFLERHLYTRQKEMEHFQEVEKIGVYKALLIEKKWLEIFLRKILPLNTAQD